MKDSTKGILYFILFCFVFAIFPNLLITWGFLTIENLLSFYLKIILIGIPLYYLLKGLIKFIKVEWASTKRYHICYHDPISGPNHMVLDKESFQYMIGTVEAPYTLAYIWVMCKKFADFKNLKLTIGGEDVYVWARFPVGNHIFYWKNKNFIHYHRVAGFRAGNNDKPYKPYSFKIPMIEDEATLINIVKQIDPKITSIKDIIEL